jgi:tripartite-type tricarboxylate transporter receptor subunit TctC
MIGLSKRDCVHSGRLCALGACVVAATLVCACDRVYADGEAVANFYAGKQITVIVGTGPGGGYDAYARLVGQYMKAHIPGQPSIVVQNMPGSAGVTAAAYIYNAAPKDGTIIAANPPDYLLAELLNPEKTRFDSRRFGWLGTVSTITDVLAVFRSSGARTIVDARTRELTIGATAAIATNSLEPALANALLGTKFRIVKGYNGGSDPMTVAMERGEIDGRANSWASWKLLRPNWITQNLLSFLLQFGPKASDLPADVPAMVDLVTTPRDKALVSALDITQYTGRALFTAPDVPSERLEALRTAFDATMADPAFVSKMSSLAFDIHPQRGAEVQATIERVINERSSVMPPLKALLNLD